MPAWPGCGAVSSAWTSGFFITAVLARELAETGDVDVNAFYTRRALRLLPAVLVTLLVTLGAVFWLYAPIDRASRPRSNASAGIDQERS